MSRLGVGNFQALSMCQNKNKTRSLNLLNQAPHTVLQTFKLDERFHIHILFFAKAKERERLRYFV